MAERKKLLITGAAGFLGWNLCNAATGLYQVTGVSRTRPVAVEGVVAHQCDLTDPEAIALHFLSTTPDAVIHCAAMVNPNDCQERPLESRRINVEASFSIARQCGERGIPCIFVSTDLVFDGTHPPYNEESAPCPIGIYGEHKLEAEEGMRFRCADLCICRVPLMYGDVPPGASSFIQPMIAAFREGREITLFTDEYRTPACGASVAQGILLALEKVRGIVHLGGRERLSRYEFGMTVAAALGIEHPRIRGALQREVASAAPRPPDVSFDSSKAFGLGYAPLPIREELARLAYVR
ncbi:MAG: NAD(P)-dependent oxidoreductase [Chitinispirillaceae bacterium]|nr:NAD(P)-dependent oxidoreductase [Chitinispirillaceae bacterium]